jgi:hypothetical protein
MKRRLKLCHPCLVTLRLRLRPLKGLAGLVNRFLGNGPTLRQGLLALDGRFRLGEIRLVLLEPSPGLLPGRPCFYLRQFDRGADRFSRRAGPSSLLCWRRNRVPGSRRIRARRRRCRRGTDAAARGHSANDRTTFELLRDVMRRCAPMERPGEPSATESQNGKGGGRHSPT